MQNFFVAAADTVKPMFLGFQNPFNALLRSYGGSKPADERERVATALESNGSAAIAALMRSLAG